MNRRRQLLIAAGGLLAAPPALLAQQQNKVWRIGFLTNGTVASAKWQLDVFVGGLKDLGFSEGANFVIESRWAEGKLERLPSLATDLLATRPDLIYAPSGIAAQAVKDLGTQIPIIFAFAPDPVGQGFGKSLSRPGGTMTGLTSTHTELSAKRVELLKEVVPSLRRVAVLYFLAPSGADVPGQLSETERAAKLLGLSVIKEESPKVEDFERAFRNIRQQKPDALIVIENPMFFTNRVRLADLALATGIPAIYNSSEYVQAGGLMSYGASYSDLSRRAASYAAKIMRGSAPGELPIERPTRLEMVINGKTAKSLGLSLPQAVLLRADRMIE